MAAGTGPRAEQRRAQQSGPEQPGERGNTTARRHAARERGERGDERGRGAADRWPQPQHSSVCACGCQQPRDGGSGRETRQRTPQRSRRRRAAGSEGRLAVVRGAVVVPTCRLLAKARGAQNGTHARAHRHPKGGKAKERKKNWKHIAKTQRNNAWATRFGTLVALAAPGADARKKVETGRGQRRVGQPRLPVSP